MNKIYFPPKGRPRWAADSASEDDLLYLSWGPRDYCKHPLPRHPKAGWCYNFLSRGSLCVVFSDRETRISQGTFFIARSDSCYGLRQNPDDGECELLAWIWKTPPTHLPDPWTRQVEYFMNVRKNCRDDITRIHRLFQREVLHAEVLQREYVQSLRMQLEIELIRAEENRSGESSSPDPTRELAETWMRANLDLNNPVTSLCDYLKMSPSSLNRMFQKHHRISPGRYFRKLKLREARKLIERENYLVKEAAYELGYKHPNDLSRALTQNPDKTGETDF